MKGHWSRSCCTPKNLVKLYQASIKNKGENVETNLVFEDHADNLLKITYLDAADFYDSPDDTNTPNDNHNA